jgi:predicted permease
VAALPGVTSAALADHVPPVAEMPHMQVVLEGQTGADADRMPPVATVKVTADYFPTMRVPLLAGRLFTDDEADAGARVVVVDETMARVFSPDESPLGRRLLVGSELAEIVGVVGAARQAGLDRPPVPTLYQPNRLGWMPIRQGRMVFVGHTELVVRAAGDPVSLVGAIRAQVDAGGTFDINRVTTVDQALWTSILQPRFHATLFGVFAAVGLMLAAVGLYGVMAFAVTRGTQEIGVRMALGAGRAEIHRAVLGQGLVLALAGVGAGLAAALAVTRVLSSLLFGVTPTDVWTFTAMATLLVAVALVACWVPARRATRVDPVVALRFE